MPHTLVLDPLVFTVIVPGNKRQLYLPKSNDNLDGNVGDGIDVWQEKKYLKYRWID